MLLIPCPWCGPRAELEFQYGGEAELERPKKPENLADTEWAQYVYYRRNPKGWHGELWYHLHGCGQFFQVVRDTVSNEIFAAVSMGEPLPEPPPRDYV